MNPSNPKEIFKELSNNNDDIIDNFLQHFPKEILDFSEAYANAYKKHMELNYLIKDTNILQKGYIAGLMYLLCKNLLSSFKIFIFGYQVPSGNMMRQVIEGVALTILCSLHDDIIISKGKKGIKTINFYESLISNKPEAQSHKAIHYLKLNSEKIGINQKGIETLEKQRKFFHNFSHPSQLSLGTSISFQLPGKSYLGGSFDQCKIENYKKELTNRTNFCKILPNIIERVIFHTKLLPNG